MPERQEEKVDDEKENVVVTGDGIEKSIVLLLKLAYQELNDKNPDYIGHPMCDHIACFLDLKAVLEDKKFQKVFNSAIPDYEDNWAKFEEKFITPKLDAILDILNNIKNLKESKDFKNFLSNCKFDLFSNSAAICNMSIASALYTICTYANINDKWIKSDENSNKLKNVIELLKDTRISERGWQYALVEKEEMYVHTLSTWLSFVSLGNIPDEILTENLRKEIETIKREAINWLKDKVYREENGYCLWCFRPGEINTEDYGDNSPNVVATAQAILALYLAGIGINDKIIKCSIDFIKNKKDLAKSPTSDIIPKAGIEQRYQGIQHCLQALLIYKVPPEDESVQYLLKKTIDIVDNLDSKRRMTRYDKYSYYTTLVPLLWYLLPSAKPEVKPVLKPILLSHLEFRSEFESFISKAENSIILIGEIDTAYAKVIEEQSKDRKINIKVYHPPKQDMLLIQDRDWNLKETDWRFENLHCAIVDKKEGLFSSEPFRETDSYNLIKRLDDEEVSNLINQLNGIIGVKPEEEIKEIVGKKFPEQSGIMDLKDLESNQLEGILEYYKPNPEYSEAIPSSLGFAGGEKRENIEVGFTSRGIISRVFMNSELESIIKNKIEDENLVMDESSAYLLLQSDKIKEIEENIKFLLRRPGPVKGELHVLGKVHDRLDKLMKDLKSKEIYKGRVRKIGDKNIDAEIESERYYLSENEKILITFTKKEKYGIITNTWEVAKRCMELGINVYSLVKFLDKNEKTYKMFRIPIDLLRAE